MKKPALLLVPAITAVLFSLLVFVSPARANVNDFTITSFDGDYSLSNKDLQGELKVRERIDVIFSGQNHGILRAIPKTYKNKSLKISHVQVTTKAGSNWPYTTYEENNNLVLKIGDPNKTVTGPNTFIIDYTLDNVITFYDDHDELYWDINGDLWNQPFLKVKATYHLASGIKSDDQSCFTGSFGATDRNCTIIKSSDDTIISENTKPLLAKETMTGVLSLEKGRFSPDTPSSVVKENIWPILMVLLPPLIIGGFAIAYWRRRGKDLKGRGVIIPEYEAPKNLTPAEAGIVIDYRLDNKDISATIIDLAVRKYLKINEIMEPKLFKDKKGYQLELRNIDYSALKPHEKNILNGIFSDIRVGAKVNLKDLKTFYTTVSLVRTKLLKSLTSDGYFPSNPARAGAPLFIAGGVLFFLGILLQNWIGLGLGLSALIVAVLGFLMPKRTKIGVAAKEHIQGLKLYLNTAEKDRIKMMQSPNSPYAEKSSEPVKTVKLFEKLLPYAILLGVENQWAKQFESIFNQPPDWYSGNWTTFNAAVFTSSLTGSVSAMGSNFSAPSSAGGSGFSGGGGSSGGGGGGGGGGGW